MKDIEEQERIYRNAMCLEIQKRGVEFKIEVPYNVYYDDQAVGQYHIDLLIEPIKPQFNKIGMSKTTNYTN